MSLVRLVLASSVLLFTGCNCGSHLVDVTPTCETQRSLCPVTPPPAMLNDGGSIEGPNGCKNLGTVTGRVCATDNHTWVNGATVTVDAKDCNGKDVMLTATSSSDGTFQLDNVPSGDWTIHAALGSFTQDTPVHVTMGQTTAIPENQLCVSQGTVKIAVISGSGDKIENLLSGLSLQYTLINGASSSWSTTAGAFLLDLNQMKQYDIIFFDCAAAHNSSAGTIDLGSQGAQIHQNLNAYVMQGGSVYASDWALVFPYYAAPGAMDFATNSGAQVTTPMATKQLMGYAPQTVSASVADADLATFLGKSSVSIDFPKQSGASSLHWGLMQNVGAGVQVLVEAPMVKLCSTTDTSCSTAGMTATSVPLAVQIKMTPANEHGGRVVYTSFHNIAQSGNDVAQILKYLILHL
jgi:hypothetical protein